MRRFVLLPAALLLLLLLCSILHGNRMEAWTGQAAQQLEQAQLLATLGDWEQARVKTRSALEGWESHRLYLHALLRHSDTDQIHRTFRAVLQYLSLEEMDQYAAANIDLIAQLRLLSEMERPSLENLL